MAEHVLTGNKVAIKILNRRKIRQMDMEEKGVCLSFMLPISLNSILLYLPGKS